MEHMRCLLPFEQEQGLEPMRWNSVKKTLQWSVFRNSPD